MQPRTVKQAVESSDALSMINSQYGNDETIRSRMIAVLAADGVDEAGLKAMRSALEAEKAMVKIVSTRLGELTGSSGNKIKIDFDFLTTSSVLYDAVYVPGGADSVEALRDEPDAVMFVDEAFKHCKPIAADGNGVNLLMDTKIGKQLEDENSPNDALQELGVIIHIRPGKTAKEFIEAIKQHRFWQREMQAKKMMV